MSGKLFFIVIRSLVFYRKQSFYQALIILILAAVFTGSLLTGYSVRESLRKSAVKKLGNTGYLISSGLRYFDAAVAGKLRNVMGSECAAILEAEGTVQKFDTGNIKINVKIYGIEHDFFRFHEITGKYIGYGEAAVNLNLASALGLKQGDEIILNHRSISDLPAGSPFAPSLGEIASYVLRIKYVLKDDEGGNFSIGISQTTPANIFVNLTDISKTGRANRILLDYRGPTNESEILSKLTVVLKPSDIGLKIRKNEITGTIEILSSRIFLSQNIIEEVRRIFPSSAPVITYLINSSVKDGRLNPYTFVSGVEKSLYPEIPQGDSVVINRWLAEDIGAEKGDVITMKWFKPDQINDLAEEERQFVVSEVTEIAGKWADSDLMPDFPGITGQVSCTRWDAGVKLNTELIRKKDEDYWNTYKGTPKIFIDYEKGKQLWGNNFGNATAIRIPGGLSPENVLNALTGSIDPVKAGFRALDLRHDMIKAASQSVEFGSLFLGLGFFILVSCLILLALSVTSALDRRMEEIFSLFATGFRNRVIIKILFTESIIISFVGSMAGALTGLLLNNLIIKALNTIWQGAVQTNTLSAYSDIIPVSGGFLVTIVISSLVQYLRGRQFLSRMTVKESRQPHLPKDYSKLLKTAAFVFIATGFMLSVSGLFVIEIKSIATAYISGTLLFAGLILLFRYFLNYKPGNSKKISTEIVSWRYYGMHPSRAVLPVLLIASGLFAVIATGVNRLELNERSTSAAGGTGGFLIWAETTIPVKENLNSAEGRKKHGLNYGNATSMSFLQARRLQGDDASCLNLNHITTPPLLGLDIEPLKEKTAFSFTSLLPGIEKDNPWLMLEKSPGNNTIYGFADQTVLQWGLKKRLGDTLIYTAESGEKLNIIIAGGLKSSVFQGYVLTGSNLFSRNFPSATGYQVFLVSGNPDHATDYLNHLKARFENFGIRVIPAKEKLLSFFEVTNTYLSVFMVLGALGMVLGVFGLGLVLRQNYSFRKKEFALMLASGFTERRIRMMVMSEQAVILVYGVITGFTGAIAATLPSAGNIESIPWLSVFLILAAILLSGVISLILSLRSIRKEPLLASLRKE